MLYSSPLAGIIWVCFNFIDIKPLEMCTDWAYILYCLIQTRTYSWQANKFLSPMDPPSWAAWQQWPYYHLTNIFVYRQQKNKCYSKPTQCKEPKMLLCLGMCRKCHCNCLPTTASEQVHVTLHMTQTTLVTYSKI